MPTHQQTVATGGVSSGTALTASSFAVGSGSNRTLVARVNYYSSGSGGPRNVSSVVFNTTENFTFRGLGEKQWGPGNVRNNNSEIWTLDNPTNTTADVVAELDASLGGDAAYDRDWET